MFFLPLTGPLFAVPRAAEPARVGPARRHDQRGGAVGGAAGAGAGARLPQGVVQLSGQFVEVYSHLQGGAGGLELRVAQQLCTYQETPNFPSSYTIFFANHQCRPL